MSKTLYTVRFLAAAVAASALAACGGGGAGTTASPSSIIPNAPSAPAATTSAPATATFTIIVPSGSSTNSTQRSPQFVSPNASSLKIETLNPDGSTPSPAMTPTIVQLKSGSACTNGAGGLTCTATASVNAGTYQFRLSTYASTDGTGSALAIATVNATIAAGKLNTIPVTLGGVVATLSFTQTRVSVPADGASHSIALSLTAKDASGAVIVAPGSFFSAVSVAKSTDPNNALSIGASSVTAPSANGANTVNVTYDGTKTLVSGTITASATGATAATTAITPLTYSVGSGTLVAGGSGTVTLTVSESGTTGPFSASANPATAVNISGGGSASAASAGGPATFTLTGGSTGGHATITVSDGSSSGTVMVSVTGSTAGITVPAQPLVTEFVADNVNGTSGPNDITSGPDGNLWYVETQAGNVGTMSTSGALLQVVPVASGMSPVRITAGPDGNLWFTESDSSHNSKIGKITRTIPSTITEYTVPTAGAHVIGIAAGPDGNLWFTEEDGNKIGKIAPSTGTITEVATATSPRDIVAGPDGAMWFTEFNYRTNPAVRKIGRITTSGTVSEFPVDTVHPTALAGEQPAAITVGADQNLWFTEFDPNGATTTADIGRMTTGGAVTIFTAGLTAGSNPDGIKLLRDGNMWFAESDNNFTFSRIGRISSATGTINEFGSGINQQGSAAGLTSGSDGNVWFTEFSINRIGRLQF